VGWGVGGGGPGGVLDNSIRGDQAGAEQQDVDGGKSAEPQVEPHKFLPAHRPVLQGLLQGSMAYNLLPWGESCTTCRTVSVV